MIYPSKPFALIKYHINIINTLFQFYDYRTEFIQTEAEKKLWKDVTQELMSDEEDGTEQFTVKIKSPSWRSEEFSNLIKQLDERRDEENNGGGGMRMKRITTVSPMKRMPPKKFKGSNFLAEEVYHDSDDYQN